MPQPPLPLFVECPHCREVLHLEQEFVHPYGLRSHTWTDGKGMCWILRDIACESGLQDDLYRGYRCGRFFWKSQAIHTRARAQRKAYKGAVSPESGDFHERLMGRRLAAHKVGRAANDQDLLRRALEAGVADSPGREMWVRLRLLWLDNDPLRAVLDPYGKGVQIVRASLKHTPEFQINADKLLALLDPDNPRELLLMADIFRQLGLFDKATALLRNTAEVFFSTQQQEVEQTRAYNEQFHSPLSEGIADLRPRIESLVLLARFIAERALERDPLVRPVRQSRAVFD